MREHHEGIGAHTRLVARLGHPVGHSLSPRIHNAAFRAQGLDMAYVAFDVHPERLVSAVEGLRGLGLRGANVTVPHKEAVVRLMDEVDVLARRVEQDRDLGPAAAIAGSASQRRHEPQVVEDHRPDVEDERLGRVEGLLDHGDEQPELAPGHLVVLAQEAFDDLGLEDDVRQALGRAIVHRPGDLTPEILLGGQHDP